MAGVIALSVVSVIWLPRMSNAALVAGSDREHPADMGYRTMGSVPEPLAEGTRTPEVAEGPPVAATTGTTAPQFESCATLTSAYPHGIGLPMAVDRPGPYRDVRQETAVPPFLRSFGVPARLVPPGGPGPAANPNLLPVKDFGRSTALYGANQDLDEDRDGIACER
ncbi:excalibur calcium-binding domain-containing protein [Kineosporia babensis]|uniref:Excalibur calcium-binding domain-containing protein n=1 Tax=Kineosporia babensis TaxID=499548 RepID=A0A9X1NI82_9ACTN|nr:excalibur calcium-binding domain-containing protein [Kineosporia babensis]